MDPFYTNPQEETHSDLVLHRLQGCPPQVRTCPHIFPCCSRGTSLHVHMCGIPTFGRTDNADSPSVPESQEIRLVMQPATVMQR